MTAFLALAFVLRLSLQRIFGDNTLLAVAVRPNPILQAMTSVRQLPRYAKVSPFARRPGFECDMGANVKFMGRRCDDPCPAKPLSRVDIVTHLVSLTGMNETGRVISCCDPGC